MGSVMVPLFGGKWRSRSAVRPRAPSDPAENWQRLERELDRWEQEFPKNVRRVH